jgi:hypothetical protein
MVAAAAAAAAAREEPADKDTEWADKATVAEAAQFLCPHRNI